jgi:peptidoglycan/xylan/chitin deacetylase (PgdA/CDA1 family)
MKSQDQTREVMTEQLPQRFLDSWAHNERVFSLSRYAWNSLCLALSLFPALLSQKEIVILSYHSVGLDSDFRTVEPKDFIRQMEYLKSNYAIVPLAEVLECIGKEERPARRMVSITFDDGYQDFYLNVYPFLRKNKLPATVFVATGYVGKEWPFVESHPKILTWEQIEEISNHNIEIGAHTVTHPNLQQEKPEKVEHEIMKSKEEIEKHLRRTVRFFSYPFGSYTNQIVEIVENAGFEAAVGGLGTIQESASLFTLNRVQVDRSISFLQFKAHLTKAVDWSGKIEQTVKTLLRRPTVNRLSYGAKNAQLSNRKAILRQEV